MAKNYNVGLKIGGTYSTSDVHFYNGVTGDDQTSNDNDYYWGTFFSAYGNININKLFFIQLEANFNQKGLKYEKDDDKDTNITLQLFEIVSILKLDLEYVRPYLGAFYSSTLYRKFIDSKGNSDISTGNSEENSDVGYILGFEIYHKNYLIDFRYSQGFNNIWGVLDTEYWSYYDNAKQFVLSFGYEF
jgi:hypothetical protein